MDYAMLVGLAAGTLTILAFLPNVIRMWKSNSSKDISLGMYLIYCTGVFLWIVYGVSIDSLPIVATNSLAFLFVLTLLSFKIKHMRDVRKSVA